MKIAGKPAIAYSIEQARSSSYVDRVVVSTDDPEIAEVARDFGAEVPFSRPAKYAGDFSPDIEVFVHALTELSRLEGYRCDYVVHLRPPTILRSVRDIDEAIETIAADPEADSLRSVHLAELSPYKMWRAHGRYLRPLLEDPRWAEPHSMPRQLLPRVYWQNGYVDVIRSDVILSGRMAGDRVLPFVVDKLVRELDTPADVARLEAWIAKHGVEMPPRDPNLQQGYSV
jgi:N-acylneuraminate cytidylyltransferase